MLKVGLIGCGFMGAMHANCYRNIEGVEVVAVADIRPEKAEALAQGATIYGDGMDLIEKADVDIIDICLHIQILFLTLSRMAMTIYIPQLAKGAKNSWHTLFAIFSQPRTLRKRSTCI